MIYDEGYNETFNQKPESIQYNACLALPGAIRGSSREKLYHELGLESLQHQHWYRKLCLFYKIFKENKYIYLFNLIPTKKLDNNTRNTDKFTLFHTKHNFFKNCFLPSAVIEWNKLDFNFFEVLLVLLFLKRICEKVYYTISKQSF